MGTEILDTCGSHVGMIATGRVIGHKVDYHFETGIVSAGHKSLELGHALIDIDSDIGIDIIIVLDRIGRAGLAFHHMGIVGGVIPWSL